MAVAAASLATNDVGYNIMVDAKSRNNAECTHAPSASACIAERLFDRLLVRLEEEQLSFGDLPITEELLWGMLHEFGFTSFLDRGKLCKRIYQKRLEDLTNRRSNNTKRLSSSNCTNTITGGDLSVAGQRCLAAACRSAHTMALDVCQATQDTNLWLQLLPTVANIGVNIQAYEIMQKHARNTRT